MSLCACVCAHSRFSLLPTIHLLLQSMIQQKMQNASNHSLHPLYITPFSSAFCSVALYSPSKPLFCTQQQRKKIETEQFTQLHNAIHSIYSHLHLLYCKSKCLDMFCMCAGPLHCVCTRGHNRCEYLCMHKRLSVCHTWSCIMKMPRSCLDFPVVIECN